MYGVCIYTHTSGVSMKVVFLSSSPVTDSAPSSYFMILYNAAEFMVTEATKYNWTPKGIRFYSMPWKNGTLI